MFQNLVSITYIFLFDLLGTIQILRKQMGWVGGLCQMLTFAYNVGGWVIANAYVSKISKYLEKK